MKSSPTLAVAVSLALLLSACQPVVRPTTPETAVVAPAPQASVATATGTMAADAVVIATSPTPAGAATATLAANAAGQVTDLAPQPAEPIQAMSTGADVFARISKDLSPNSCSAGSNSARWRKRYAGNPAGFARRIEQVLPLIDFVSTEVERAGLPGEFVFIPLVESWYKPGAIGPGGPAGMWQMIASTARNHGIHINSGYDGRLSPVESTRAALSYLKVLQDMFGNWQAIVMAYNAGEGRMQHAMRRAGNRTASAADRRPHGLSNITYDYVAKLQALSCLVSEPQRFGLRLPSETRFEPLVPLLMDAKVETLEQFAAASGKDAAALRRMNPSYRNGRITAGVPRLVLAPPGRSTQSPDAVELAATERLVAVVDSARERGTDPAPTLHQVRPGESLWTIARTYHLPVEQLRRVNGLGSKAVVRPGQKLRLVP